MITEANWTISFIVNDAINKLVDPICTECAFYSKDGLICSLGYVAPSDCTSARIEAHRIFTKELLGIEPSKIKPKPKPLPPAFPLNEAYKGQK